MERNMGYVPDDELPDDLLRESTKGHGHRPKKKESKPLPKRKGENEWGDEWDDDEID